MADALVRSAGMKGLTIHVHNLGDVTLFCCSGRIVAGHHGALHDAVVNQPHSGIVVLDLAEVSAIDAAGLGALLSLKQWANDTGRKLRLWNLATFVEEVLQLTNLRVVFEVCSAREIMELMHGAVD